MKSRLFLFIPVAALGAFVLLLGIGVWHGQTANGTDTVGKPLPEFFSQDLNGKPRSLADLPKTPFVLNVWASWCGYCRQEFPLLKQLAAKGVPVVGVNYADNPAAARQMLAQLGDPFLWSVQDNGEKGIAQLGYRTAPQTYLIDRFGVIRAAQIGQVRESDWQSHFAPILEQLKTQ